MNQGKGNQRKAKFLFRIFINYFFKRKKVKEKCVKEQKKNFESRFRKINRPKNIKSVH